MMTMIIIIIIIMIMIMVIIGFYGVDNLIWWAGGKDGSLDLVGWDKDGSFDIVG